MPSPRDALPCALLVIVGFHASSAQAQPHQVCIYLDLGADLWDASPRAADGEDFREEYGRNEGPTSYPAQRWLAQAVAAVEGIASWYSVSVWNDVDLVECKNCQSGVRYVHPTSETEALTYAVPRGSPLCTAMGEPPCPAGVGNEWDWMSAFRLFRLQAPMPPSFRTLFTMLSATYQAGTWPPASADGSFWEAVDLAMVDHLGPHYAAWHDAATQMELDR